MSVEARRVVGIAGRVTDGTTGRPVGGARVEISSAPARFRRQLAAKAVQHGQAWDAMEQRPDRTTTAADGHFHFVDLCTGQYKLTASWPGAGDRYGTAQARVEVTAGIGGRIRAATADLALPVTTVAGTVTGPGSAPLAMARLRVQGSGESVFSDVDGWFSLAGVEAGTRTIVATAPGFTSASKPVVVKSGATRTVKLVLVPSTT